VAFGLRSGSAPDRFLVGLAVLGLLSDVAADQPLLCLIDDGQWLDQTSAQVLAFVARRLDAESVAVLFGTRDPGPGGDLAALPELVLAGLPDADAWALLASVIPGRLDERVRDRIIAESGGNPLALLELPHLHGDTVGRVQGEGGPQSSGRPTTAALPSALTPTGAASTKGSSAWRAARSRKCRPDRDEAAAAMSNALHELPARSRGSWEQG
jgi:hypothetical protein